MKIDKLLYKRFKKMLWLALVIFSCVHHITGLRYIDIGNRNNFPIWIETKTNGNKPPLRGIVRINPGDKTRYNIPDNGWAGRLWPKIGCDNNGVNCEFGQSIAPCPNGGCQPPAETKVEFFFPSINSPDDSYYDISLVDGFSLASEIIPYRDGKPLQQGSCIRTDCQLHLLACPRNEKQNLGDLTVKSRNNKQIACLSPCKKWNYPAPYGYGRNEQNGNGRMLCCPDPVTPGDCRRGIVINTDYVKLVRQACPTAYSYSYDDKGGLHNCPASASYVVNFYS